MNRLPLLRRSALCLMALGLSLAPFTMGQARIQPAAFRSTPSIRSLPPIRSLSAIQPQRPLRQASPIRSLPSLTGPRSIAPLAMRMVRALPAGPVLPPARTISSPQILTPARTATSPLPYSVTPRTVCPYVSGGVIPAPLVHPWTAGPSGTP